MEQSQESSLCAAIAQAISPLCGNITNGNLQENPRYLLIINFPTPAVQVRDIRSKPHKSSLCEAVYAGPTPAIQI